MAQNRAKMPRLDIGQYEMAFKVLVSPHAAGKIIGRGGAEITALRQQLGVGCHIHSPDSPFPGTGLQVAVLFGSRPNIDAAFEGLIAKIAEAESEQHAGQLLVISVMTSNAVSAVIGTKGATIAALRQQAGCGFSADKEVHFGEQLVRISGPVARIPAALTLLSPFVERSGDSLQYAMQDYSLLAGGCGGWEGPGWTPSPAVPPAPQWKGSGKRIAPQSIPPWTGQAPALPALIPAAPMAARQRVSSPGAGWQLPQQVASPPEEVAPQRPDPPQLGSLSPVGLPGELDVAAPVPQAPVEGLGLLQTGFAAAQPNPHVVQACAGQDATPAPDDPAVLTSPATVAFPIPKESIGRVLGRGGESSERIRRTTGVSLNIDPGEGEATVVLAGTLSAVHQAHCMVVARVLAHV